MRTWPTAEFKAEVFRQLGYKPSAGGQAAAHASVADVIGVFGAERAGKSEWAEKETTARVPYCDRVVVCADEYDECHREMGGIIANLAELGALVSCSMPQHGQWRAVVHGGIEIKTLSLHDGPGELTGTGEAYDLVVLVEAGRIRFDTFLAALGRVAEKRGAVLLSGTLLDDVGWYADMYEDLQGENVFGGEGFSLPAWENLHVFPGGRSDPEILRLERILSPEEFARRVAAQLLPSPARVYGDFNAARNVRVLEFDRTKPVELVVDPGYYPSHYAVLAMQVVEEQFEDVDEGGGRSVYTMEVVRQIDEVWENHVTHADVVEICRDREWWPWVRCAVGGHETRQHQAAASTQEAWEALVNAGDARDRQSLEVRAVLGETDWKPGDPEPRRRFWFEIVDAGRVQDGVGRVKTFIKDPLTKKARLVVDANRNLGTLYEVKAYRKRVNPAGRVVHDEPMDKDNDAMDCWRNYIIWRFGHADAEPRRARGRRQLRKRRGVRRG